MTDAERRQRLQVDIDTRLAKAWEVIWAEGSVLRPILREECSTERDAFAAVLRYAYSKGYSDALAEDAAGRRDELARANGYAAS